MRFLESLVQLVVIPNKIETKEVNINPHIHPSLCLDEGRGLVVSKKSHWFFQMRYCQESLMYEASKQMNSAAKSFRCPIIEESLWSSPENYATPSHL